MKHLYLFGCLMWCASVLSAQSLEECRQLARNHYPEIQRYGLISKTEQYNLSNATKAWAPQVVFSGQATYQSDTPNYPDAFSAIMQANGLSMSGIRKDQYKVVLDVTQNIWDGGKSKADKEMVAAEAEEQRRRVDVSLYELQSRVDNIYFGILLLDERVAQTETLIKVLESNLSRMRAYHKNGIAMQADVNLLEAELITAQQTLSQVISSRTSYRRVLELFIGSALTSDRLERPVMTDLNSRTSARPELQLFQAQEDRLQTQRQSIKSSLMPRFSAFAQGYYGYPGLDMFKSMVDSEWTLNAIVGVRMSWNLGAFYTRKSNLEKLNSSAQQIAVQRDVFLFNTLIQTTQDDGEISRLKKTIKEDDRIVQLRSAVRKAAESQLEHGVIDATDLLRKITDETAASLNRSTHEIELLQAIYRLKTTLNQ